MIHFLCFAISRFSSILTLLNGIGVASYSRRYSDFFIYIEANDPESLKRQLVHQRDWYYYLFKEHQFSIKFACDDRQYYSLIREVNETKPKET